MLYYLQCVSSIEEQSRVYFSIFYERPAGLRFRWDKSIEKNVSWMLVGGWCWKHGLMGWSLKGPVIMANSGTKVEGCV
jgi:hypothetical protein